MNATAIWIDSREPESIQKLDFDGIPTMTTTLDCGDVWVSTDNKDLIIVERKTGDDLLNSIKDGRLFQQATAMRARTAWCYVVVTDALNYNHNSRVVTEGRVSGWNWNALQGALLDVQELGVRVVYCAGETDYANTVLRLAKRERSAERIIEPAAKSRIASPAEVILTALPGIGWERAQTLLDRFESAAHTLAWLTWQNTMLEVAGIGGGTKTSVRRALGLKDDEELCVWTPQDAAYYATIHKEAT